MATFLYNQTGPAGQLVQMGSLVSSVTLLQCQTHPSIDISGTRLASDHSAWQVKKLIYLQHLISDIISTNALHWSLFVSPVLKRKRK